jgi:hypothetical protein
MTGFCKTKIPAEVSDALESIKDNDEAVKVSLLTASCAQTPPVKHHAKGTIVSSVYMCGPCIHGNGPSLLRPSAPSLLSAG